MFCKIRVRALHLSRATVLILPPQAHVLYSLRPSNLSLESIVHRASRHGHCQHLATLGHPPELSVLKPVIRDQTWIELRGLTNAMYIFVRNSKQLKMRLTSLGHSLEHARLPVGLLYYCSDAPERAKSLRISVVEQLGNHDHSPSEDCRRWLDLEQKVCVWATRWNRSVENVRSWILAVQFDKFSSSQWLSHLQIFSAHTRETVEGSKKWVSVWPISRWLRCIGIVMATLTFNSNHMNTTETR